MTPLELLLISSFIEGMMKMRQIGPLGRRMEYPTMSRNKRNPLTTRANPQRTAKQSPPPSTIRIAKVSVPVAPQRPEPDDTEGWKAYWKERGPSWRKEPVIAVTRQEELARRYAIVPDARQTRYRLEGMKLNRADIEWLLATYQDQFTSQEGLDVRGAILDGEDLSALPLNQLRGGPLPIQIVGEKQRNVAPVNMGRVSLVQAELNGADLTHAQLWEAQLEGAQLYGAQLTGAWLNGAQLTGANLMQAQLEGAQLYGAQLEGVNLIGAQLEGARLSKAQLTGAYLWGAQLEGADLQDTILAGLDGIGPEVVDVQWNGVNLALIEWSQITMLGDENAARQKRHPNTRKKRKDERLWAYHRAVRANRQLAVALQNQGLNEEASRFAYRANRLQCAVLWFQMIQSKTASGRQISLWYRVQKFGAWMFSYLLNVLAGYGYKPGRSFLAYLLIVFGFMGLYLLTSHFTTPHLSWDEALVLSLSSFHGRGFFTQTLTLGDPYARLAVAEAVLGLFVEVSLIATFTQRFFGK